MSENVSLVVSAQSKLPDQPQQQQQSSSAHQTSSKPRPLGRVRATQAGTQQQQQQQQNHHQRKSEDFSVHGEAYTAVEKQSLPPIQTTPQHQRRQSGQQSPSSSLSTGPSDALRLARLAQREQELLKKLQEAVARERLLKEQADRLEKMLSTQQQMLEEERQSKLGSDAQLAEATDNGDRYRRLYEEECRAHEDTRQRLAQEEERHREEAAQLQAQARELKTQLEQAESRHATELSQLRREHQQALAERDKRIENLKRQVAGALGTNSQERQSQIDQLNRELQKATEEVESLRKQRANGGRCQQCGKKDAAIQELGDQVRQLQTVCQRFRGQLTDQEQMLVMLLDKNTTSGLPKAKR